MEVMDLLPIGSVVRLKNGEKKLMIIGIKQTETEGDKKGEEFDYLGVFYPEGYIGTQYQFLFNGEDVEELYFRGHEDDERKAFIARLNRLYSER